MSAQGSSLDLNTQFLRLLGGKWITAAISAAASLGLAEALSSGPKTLHELSEELACDRQMLARLLRVLECEGILARNTEHGYTLTALGALLEQNKLGKLSQFIGAPFSWAPWSFLAEAIKRGVSAFEVHHGQPLFDYLESRPEHASLYHEAVDAFTTPQALALAQCFDFSSLKHIADVGGGRGTLLVEVLKQWPHLQGTLLDRAPAIALAKQRFKQTGMEQRCNAVIADFFQPLPGSYDVCVIKHVVHNWDDAAASKLLTNCASAVGVNGYVLIVEGLLLPGNRPDMTRQFDLEMLALCGLGKERSKPEMRKLLASSGLRLTASHDLAGTTRLLVCQPSK